MLQISKLKEHSFLIYGLGLSGISVIRFFKKNKIKNFKVWDDKKIKTIQKLQSEKFEKNFKTS